MKTLEEKYTFRLSLQVRDYEVDAEGIVNNAIYLHYMEHTRHEFCREAGLSFRAMHQQGIDPVVSKIEIHYRSSLTLSDEFISCLNIKRRGAQFIFQQDIYKKDGTLVTEAIVHIACIEHGKLTRGEPLAEAFAMYL